MKKFAIIGSRRPPRIGCIAIIGGALLGSVAVAGPAQSADLYYPPPPYYQYQYTGYPGYNYRSNCYTCCNPCCNPCGYRPYIRPRFVVERHWDYWERRYPLPHPPYPPYRYPYYPSGYAGYPTYPYPDGYAAYNGPRPHLGFGGVQYPQGPAPISYETEAPPGAPYDYQASAGPAYDYDASPRPPAGIPGGYYNAGYVE